MMMGRTDMDDLGMGGMRRVDLRIALLAFTTVFYALTFLPLRAELGPGVVSLSAVPVALAGWLFGLRAGLLFGAISFPMNTGLLSAEQGAELNEVIWGGAVAGSASLMVGAVAGALRDVTERLSHQLTVKQGSEDGLRESEERMNNLANSAPSLLVMMRGDGTILYSNRAIGEFDTASIRGTNMFNFVPRQHHDMFRRALESAFTTGEASGYEVSDTMAVGTPTLHVIRFGPVKRDGKVVAATLLSLDINDEGY